MHYREGWSCYKVLVVAVMVETVTRGVVIAIWWCSSGLIVARGEAECLVWCWLPWWYKKKLSELRLKLRVHIQLELTGTDEWICECLYCLGM